MDLTESFTLFLSAREIGQPSLAPFAASVNDSWVAPDAGWTVQRAHITVRGSAPGATQESFAEAANGAKDGCPISRALTGNVELSVEAFLEG